MNVSIQYPLSIYFDASCPLCMAEMSALKRHDSTDRLVLIDCSPVGFRDQAAEEAGLQREDFMRIIHARAADGTWLRGVDVFAAAYSAVGLKVLAFVWQFPVWRPLLDWLYPFIARNRQLLSRLGIPAVVRLAIGALGGRQGCEGSECVINRAEP
jgi:predicted DCC family thiol-disulfide oxidoreductase YuxK